jgi:hypothetical protein
MEGEKPKCDGCGKQNPLVIDLHFKYLSVRVELCSDCANEAFLRLRGHTTVHLTG